MGWQPGFTALGFQFIIPLHGFSRNYSPAGGSVIV